MMMLDLNVGIISGDSACDEASSVMEKIPAEESQTSISSVVSAEGSRNNAAEVNFSPADTSSLVFDVFKKETATREVNGKNSGTEFVTHQLFPVAGGGASDLGKGSPAKTQWLNLSFSDKAAQAELKIAQQKQQQVRKSRRGPRSRSSQFRGVTFYRRTGRWESHIWDCGKQVYLGGFDTAHSAARAYDRAAIKFRGVDADINFSLSDYDEDMKQAQNLSKEEFVQILRRQNTGFARGSSKFRGMALHKSGRWEGRMGQFLGKKDYDKAAIQFNGKEALTNFEPSGYQGEMPMLANPGTNSHNLELSLGMSLPSNGHKETDAAKGYRLQYAARDMKMIESTALSPHGLPVASKHSWPSIYPGFLPTYEGRTMEQRVEALATPKLSSWSWQAMHNNKGAASALPAYSNAASSGFASSGNTTISSALQRQNNLAENLYRPRFVTPQYSNYRT